MKKFFTLLFCVTAMSFAANAADNMTLVDQCIDVLMSHEQPTATMMATLDANQDGVINIADVTTLIDMSLQAKLSMKAPAKKSEVQTMIDDMLDNEPPRPTIHEVTEAIDKSIEKNK